MKKRSILGNSILLAMMFPGVTLAEADISGYIKNETAVYTVGGQLIGSQKNTYDTTEVDSGDLLKSETIARIFINGEMGEDTTWHADLNFAFDSQGISDSYKGHKSYTQNDWLRELYLDTTIGGWFLRLGKQQVVWGTADGIKLLDIINPTDYRDFSQNTPAESRIPVWMLNAETDIGETGNIQLIISQARENKIAGLNGDGDAGHPFLLKGVESITGRVNGFLHIVPNLSNVATSFTLAAGGGLFQFPDGQGGVLGVFSGPGNFAPPTLGVDGAPGSITFPGGLLPFSGLSVDGFAGVQWDTSNGGILFGPPMPLSAEQLAGDSVQNILNPQTGVTNGFTLLNGIAQVGLFGFRGMEDPYANGGQTNLLNENGSAWVLDPVNAPSTTTVSWNVANPTAAFEYMPNASFATFNTFSANDWLLGTPAAPGLDPTKLHGANTAEYVKDYPAGEDPNFGMRYRGFMDNGLNFSLNYFYGYDSNPTIGISTHDATTGEKLKLTLVRPGEGPQNADGSPNQNYNPAFTAYAPENSATVITANQVSSSFDGTIAIVSNAAGQFYGAYNPITGGLAASLANPDAGHSANGTVMRFTESLQRAQNIGGSFDYAIETSFAPVVLRGEFLYKKDELHPVIDRRLLGIGFIDDALVATEHDIFKFVIGVDVNVFTNMLVSGQFIQFRNLDYVNEQRTCSTQTGASFNCSRYTADLPVLNLSNGLNKAEENKEFYSLFLSKPFGESQEHRWNNIVIFEENGGFWNRFDVEYSFTDSLIGTAELNHYWGDEDTTFGQLHNSSNFQLGIKYIFD